MIFDNFLGFFSILAQLAQKTNKFELLGIYPLRTSDDFWPTYLRPIWSDFYKAAYLIDNF